MAGTLSALMKLQPKEMVMALAIGMVVTIVMMLIVKLMLALYCADGFEMPKYSMNYDDESKFRHMIDGKAYMVPLFYEDRSPIFDDYGDRKVMEITDAEVAAGLFPIAPVRTNTKPVRTGVKVPDVPSIHQGPATSKPSVGASSDIELLAKAGKMTVG